MSIEEDPPEDVALCGEYDPPEEDPPEYDPPEEDPPEAAVDLTLNDFPEYDPPEEDPPEENPLKKFFTKFKMS
jgi:hypothetical protein